ncbi:ComF family protein [Gluconacetobacter azotocaptans]|uniref:ComF family protein n=1 Tax=Gluconacetobacter azotocaptans TaxID=142834 RepID=A0A7W4JU78_9PROT|nr:ComF family protein [Gluconacetobacter azotocaptans]MBB2190895.1 ComF family protein [Gluconacetobacter azotocaptans]GBQ31675.1 competence protein F [Gluconacetobacter azotocaptans DSM 13594]
MSLYRDTGAVVARGIIPGATRALLRAGSLLLDTLLPPDCPSCHGDVDRAGHFCPTCFRQLTFIADPCCARCGQPFVSASFGGARMICAPCEETPPPWHAGRAALVYDEWSRRLILGLKYGDRTELAPILAAHMGRIGRSMLDRADIVVPVPLHRRRLFGRRYNQAALLVWALARQARIAVGPDTLVRVRATAPLARLGRAARRDILRGVIAIRPRRRDAIANRRVVLVDDVMTTGATLGECTRVLLAAGAASVDVLVAARAPAPDEPRHSEKSAVSRERYAVAR